LRGLKVVKLTASPALLQVAGFAPTGGPHCFKRAKVQEPMGLLLLLHRTNTADQADGPEIALVIR
jgi:hypothetical protein